MESHPKCPWNSLGPVQVRYGVGGRRDGSAVHQDLRSIARARDAHAVIEIVRDGDYLTGEMIRFTDPDCMH